MGSSLQISLVNIKKLMVKSYPHLIHQVGRIDSITADKAYDQSRVYEAANDTLKERGQINIHPRANTIILAADESAIRQRNLHIKSINQDGVLALKKFYGKPQIRQLWL